MQKSKHFKPENFERQAIENYFNILRAPRFVVSSKFLKYLLIFFFNPEKIQYHIQRVCNVCCSSSNKMIFFLGM